jgi:hypothetical protein
VGAGPAIVVNPAHAGCPSVPLLVLVELELVVAPEVELDVVVPELELDVVVVPELELDVVVAPVLDVVLLELWVVGPLDVPPAPPVAAGALEPHRAVARPQSAARICRARKVERVVRVMSVNSSS